MSTEGSECSGGTCVSGTLCSLRELAVGSEWERVAERLSQGHRCCSACVEFVLHKAVQEQQWDCAVQLSENCSGLQRSEVVHTLMAHSQWGGVVQLMKLSITSETVRAVVERAVQEGQWECIRQMLKIGLPGQELGWLCEQAADRQQWDVVMQLVEMGVTTALRNQVWQSAVLHCHVPCAAKLIESGVSQRDREDCIRKEIACGQCDFVLQVVKMVEDPELTKVVLQESLKQKQWPLVGELVKEGLSVAQMEAACAQAVADRQWTVALQLLHGGVSASQWMVDEFFENRMAPALLDLLPAGCGGDGLRGLLLMGSIRHGQGDFTLLLLQQLSVSDTELIEAMKYAVHLQDKTMLLLIIRASSRSRRVFKQKFIHQHWKMNLQPEEFEYDEGDGDEICWLFDTFYAAGEKDLALYVATSDTSEAYLIADFCENEKHDFDLKRKKFRYALEKLFEQDHQKYTKFVEAIYMMPKTPQSDRSFLFRQAIRLGRYGVATCLCEHGVSRKDLKFAVRWLFQCDAGRFTLSQVCSKARLKDKYRDWLRQYSIRFAMTQYFKQKSDTCLKNFFDCFWMCSDKTLSRQIFREAVGKCVEFDCADCFVQLCGKQLIVCKASAQGTVLEDCIFAYTSAITGNRPHFISKVCETKIAGQYSSAVPEFQLVIDIIAEKEAWNMLPRVSPGFEVGPVKVLEYCVHKMLGDEAIWPGIAPVLDQWIGGEDLGYVAPEVPSVHKTLVREQWPLSLSSLKEWCVDTGHANLAFFLAVVSGDWELVETLMNTLTTRVPHQSMLMGGVGLAAEKHAISAGVAILKILPIGGVNVQKVCPYKRRKELAKACEDEGLLDWALALNQIDWTYVEAHHGQCQNPAVLKSILETAAENRRWDLTRQLMTRCTDTETVKHVLQKAVENGQVDIAETLISRVDPSTVTKRDFTTGHKTLLFAAVAAEYDISSETRLKMVCLCVASGLSTFQRDVKFENNDFNGDHNCPMLWALGTDNLKIIKLMLACGAYSHKRLHSIRTDREMQSALRKRRVDEIWKTGYRCMLKAAATPSPLKHMARLVVSHSIGCQPGRLKRIERLNIPKPLEDLLRFKDVLFLDTKTDPNSEADK